MTFFHVANEENFCFNKFVRSVTPGLRRHSYLAGIYKLCLSEAHYHNNVFWLRLLFASSTFLSDVQSGGLFIR